jgi:hypothetical protein
MGVSDRPISVTQALQQLGGALDVGEQKVTVPVGNAVTGERGGGADRASAAWELAVNRSLSSVARSSRTSRPSSAGVRKYR